MTILLLGYPSPDYVSGSAAPEHLAPVSPSAPKRGWPQGVALQVCWCSGLTGHAACVGDDESGELRW